MVCHGINAEETRGDLEEVEGLSGHVVTSLSLGRDFACAGTAEGVWCWGSNASGELGSDVVTASPLEAVQVPGVPGDVASLASGRTHSCAATAEGVWCWGSNAKQAQLATGEHTVWGLRDGPRGLTLLVLDNGREYNVATGLQHNSEETVIASLRA